MRGGSDSSFAFGGGGGVGRGGDGGAGGAGGGSGATDRAFADVGGAIAGMASVFCARFLGGAGGAAGGGSASARLRVLAGAAPRASGAGIARCVPCVGSGAVFRDGRPGGGLRLLSFDGGGSFGNPDDVTLLLLPLLDGTFAFVLATFTASGVTAGMRVVESMRVGGTESPSSAIE